MWKDIKVTLYDIFGYLLPGAVILGGLLLSLKACGVGQLLFRLPDAERWVLLFLGAYYLGHLAQGVGNELERIVGEPADLMLAGDGKHKGYERCRTFFLGEKRWDDIPKEFRDAAGTRVKKLMGLEAEVKVGGKLLYQCCVAVIDERGNGGQREMYEYREGFYRGSVIALFLLPLILLVAYCNGRIPGPTLAEASAFSLLAAFLSFRRYGRFSESRVKSTIFGSLVVKDQISNDGKVSSPALPGAPS